MPEFKSQVKPAEEVKPVEPVQQELPLESVPDQPIGE
jgi:hypothetical protein